MLRRSRSAVASILLAVGLAVTLPSSPAAAYDNDIGVIKVPNQIRKGGCAGYLLPWSFTPPTEDWTVVARIRNPRREGVASFYWDANAGNNMGRTHGHLTFQLCGASAPVGRYSVSMQMIYNEGRDLYTLNRAPTHFRLVQRR
ncbi:hypothetical protein [Nocardioides plantarum]|uniref:Secreted protein n=1 Tax=Nocardioides plantarum TaxID=29299 RepID=A0ABV5K5M5_9ACTN|nr:hypothetical protein [Nocardioides plantarum]